MNNLRFKSFLILFFAVAVSTIFFGNLQKANASCCENSCGDGICQEYVCMACGCPCAETITSCFQDCGRAVVLPPGAILYSLTATADKSLYEGGETVSITLDFWNKSASSKSIVFLSSKQVDFTISDGYTFNRRWSTGQTFVTEPNTITVAANSHHIWYFTYQQPARVFGDFTITPELKASGIGSEVQIKTASYHVTAPPEPPSVNIRAYVTSNITSNMVTGSAGPLTLIKDADALLTLELSATNATFCSTSYGAIVTVNPSGIVDSHKNINGITASKTFSATCTGDYGVATGELVITAIDPTPPQITFTVNGNSSSATITSGSSATLLWSTTDASSCTASGDWSGTKSTYGYETISSITSDKDFTLTCHGTKYSGTVSKTVLAKISTITPIDPTAPTITSFTVNGNSSSATITSGSSATLSWSTTNATSCTSSGDWSGTKSTSGNQTIYSITSDEDFTLKCSNPAGTTASKTVYAHVSSTTNPTPITPIFTRTLYKGMEGDDVSELQRILAKDPAVYPEGKITGYFWTWTEQAVIRFQEKYASEILTPIGLTHGTGIVASMTIKKLEALRASGY